MSDGGEGLKTAVESDRTWWSAGSIAVPPPEAGNNPSGSGKAGGWMRVFLLGRLAFQRRIDGTQDFNLGRREGDQGGLMSFSIARLEELEGHRGCLGGDRSQLEQALGLGDLAVLQSQSLLFEKPKKLLKDPS